jgi:hypothetical protein
MGEPILARSGNRSASTAWLRSAGQLGPLRVQALMKQVVLPTAGDAQVPRSQTDSSEVVVGQDPLGSDVVDESVGLKAMQLKLAERPADRFGDRCRGHPSTVDRLVDPVAQMRGLERTTDDVVDVEPPDGLAVGMDDVRDDQALIVSREGLFELCALSLLREPGIVPNWVPPCEEGSVGPEQAGDGNSIVRRTSRNSTSTPADNTWPGGRCWIRTNGVRISPPRRVLVGSWMRDLYPPVLRPLAA